jgi:hypothetical protein
MPRVIEIRQAALSAGQKWPIVLFGALYDPVAVRAFSSALGAVLVLALVAAGCGGAEESPAASEPSQPSEFARAVSCGVARFTVSFDPKEQVLIEDGGRELAWGSFTDRRVDGDCRVVREGMPAEEEAEQIDSSSLGDGVYAPVELTCSAPSPITINVNPIYYRRIGGRVDGSSVSVSSAGTSVAAAVLKNKGDPRASRIYFAARFCAAA